MSGTINGEVSGATVKGTVTGRQAVSGNVSGEAAEDLDALLTEQEQLIATLKETLAKKNGGQRG